MPDFKADAPWKWFGHAGHFICAQWCRYHLCTLIGNRWLVSTVGEYWPERTIREFHAKSNDPKWFLENADLKGDYFDAAYMKRFGFETIGYNRKYETMVFDTNGKLCESADCGCGLPDIIPSELDSKGYNAAGDASSGHLELCQKWASIAEKPKSEWEQTDA